MSRSYVNASHGPIGRLISSNKRRHTTTNRTDKCSRAMALKAGDTVLVHVTAFKGQHKIQNRWENREYVVEWWPYPTLQVYVECPRDGKSAAQTLHRNYLLPISNNLG